MSIVTSFDPHVTLHFGAQVLRAHTRYGAGVTPKQRHVRYLWQSLGGFTKEQRRAFLKFMWGRTRLPLTDQARPPPRDDNPPRDDDPP
eukprot:1787220-Prymnesium_polylepis.1